MRDYSKLGSAIRNPKIKVHLVKIIYLTILVVVISFLSTSKGFTQSINTCEIPIQDIIPEELLKAESLLNPNEIKENYKLVFNDTWIEKVRLQGQYCRAVYLRDITKSDLMNNHSLRVKLEVLPKENLLRIDSNAFYYQNKIFLYKPETTYYKYWLALDISDYDDDDFYSVVISDHCYYNSTLPYKFKIVDLSELKGLELNILKNNLKDEIVFKVGDSLVVGGWYSNTIPNTPMLKDISHQSRRESFNLNTSLIGRKILIEPIDDPDYSRTSFPFYKINKLHVEKDKTILLMEAYNSEGERIGKDYVGIELVNPELKLYDFDCSIKNMEEERSTALKYREYLEKMFTPIEIKHIIASSIYIGMREIALYESIGYPIRSNKTIMENLVSIQCVYGDGIYVYIHNGKVSVIQNFESFKR